MEISGSACSSYICRNNGIIVDEVTFPTRLHENFRNGKENSREAGIAYAPLEQRRHLERVFCALMYRYAATE